MKLKVNIDSNLAENAVYIDAIEMSSDINCLIQYVQSIDATKILNGKLGDHIYRVNLAEVYRFFTENKIVKMETETQNFVLNKRLYEIESIINHHFIKISKSEIINIHYLDHLSMTATGQIKICFKNDIVTYSSRRYLKSIKERLEL
ncbi:LytTR family transcriptional regulator [Staphylococcus succinus]|nr:LytTR family transcriptional regulator [Staphylococcus succinus]